MNFIFSPPYPTRFLPNSWWPRNEWILDRSQTDLQRIPKYSSFNLEAASSNSPCFPFLWCPLVTSLFLGVKLICSFVAVKRACRSQSPCGGVGGLSHWGLSESRNLEGSVNSSRRFYFSLTDGYFSHSQRPPGTAISYNPGWKPIRWQSDEACVTT